MTGDRRVLVLDGVGKAYRGRRALSDATLSLESGRVLGFVGPNGAGKTTLLRIVSGLAWPTSGTGRVLGQEIGPGRRPSPFVGMTLERPTFVEHRSGRDNLRMLASVRATIDRATIDRALESVGLDPTDSRPTRSYSLGMRQRLSIAQAIMESPPLLLLDEPTNGLDPSGIVDVRRLVRRLADESGMAILLASHMLTEVEAVCDEVIMVEKGRIRGTFRPGAQDAGVQMVDLVLEFAEQVAALAAIPGVRVVSTEQNRVRVSYAGDRSSELVRALVRSGIDLEGFAPAHVTLEDAYLQMVAGARA